MICVYILATEHLGVEQYFLYLPEGGLSCCHHGDVLLDADQPVDNRTDEYHLKYRFWFQDYVPATATAPASHQNLHRVYYTTETWAGEYDVVQCPPGTPSTECVQEISARWQVCSTCTFFKCRTLARPCVVANESAGQGHGRLHL